MKTQMKIITTNRMKMKKKNNKVKTKLKTKLENKEPPAPPYTYP
jgi:hypothetical protein